MKKSNLIILVVLCFISAGLNLIPRIDYFYPLHVDEYVHYQFTSNITEKSPLYFGGEEINLEYGFHLLLASLNYLGIPFIIIFSIIPAILTIILCLSVFIAAREIFDERSALFSVLFIALLRSSPSILGPMFLVPMSIGLILISIGLYFLEKESPLFFIPLAGLLLIHPPSAIAYFAIINIHLAIKKKDIINNILLEGAAFLIALPLYIPLLLNRGVRTLNELNFIIINNPLFIPKFIGYIPTLFVLIGIYFSIKKRFDLSAYSIFFLLIAFVFYQYKIEFFIPYARVLMVLFIIFSILFGYGLSMGIESIKKKYLKITALIVVISLVLVFSFGSKLSSTENVYQIINEKDYKAFIYIKENSPKDSIVIADPWISNALTPIAQRGVYSRITQGPNEFYEDRNREIIDFFKGGCKDINLLEMNNISVIYGGCNNSLLNEVYPSVYFR